MSRPTHMTIDLGALKANFQRVQKIAPHSRVIAMVKANAYGHGLNRVGNALKEADALGVASLEEGISLREAGVTSSIVLMEGLFAESELSLAAHYQFDLVVHHEIHVQMLERAKTEAQSFNIWLKINSGMNRLGVSPEQVDLLYTRLRTLPIVNKPIGLMTHFAEADFLDRETTKKQIEIFRNCSQHLSGPRSLANSAAILAWPDSYGDFVRPGLMLYGASPFVNKTGSDFQLQPVMTLTSRIIAIQKVKKGEKVGYGGTWTAPHDITIGVVGVGYGDGYPQFAPNGTPVLVRDVMCELVGRVSMDMLTINLSSVPNASLDDLVTLWGKELPIENVARYARSSAYEILTRMTPRPKIEVIMPEKTIPYETQSINK